MARHTITTGLVALFISTIALTGNAYGAKENFERTKPHAKKEQQDSKKKPKEIVVVGSEGKQVEVTPEAQEKAKKKREKGSGMATGKRQHKPVSVTKEMDKSSPKLMENDKTDKNEQARSKKKK